ncbi:MAG: hypothetical protein HOV80_28525 [Polyangiaceae bacterium]|nr:hypothetical protein [Polyangiaceae bacterium]
MKDVVYAYIEGSDLDAIVDVVVERCEAFVEGRAWATKVAIVNQRHGRDWDLGLNIETPRRRAPKGLEADVASLAEFLKRLAAETGRDIVVGLALDGRSAEDVLCVSTNWSGYEVFRRLFLQSEEPREVARYPYRTVGFDFEDGRPVAVAGRRRTAFDFVSGFVLMHADGTRPVNELLAELQATPNTNLRGDHLPAVLDALRTLQRAGFVALSDTPCTLPYHFAVAVSEQDPELASASVQKHAAR